MTVVEALFDKLHWETEKMWMRPWLDLEKDQMFLFFIAGIAASKVDYPEEVPFIKDAERYEKYRDLFNKHYQAVYNKEGGD